MSFPFREPIIDEKGVIIWPPVDIHPNVIIGVNVVLGRYTNICTGVSIGDLTRIQGFCFIPEGVTIGKNVFIGPNVTFTNTKYLPKHVGEDTRYLETIIEDGVGIGGGCVICPGVIIKRDCFIAAGSVVTKNIGPGWLYKGNPARAVRQLT